MNKLVRVWSTLAVIRQPTVAGPIRSLRLRFPRLRQAVYCSSNPPENANEETPKYVLKSLYDEANARAEKYKQELLFSRKLVSAVVSRGILERFVEDVLKPEGFVNINTPRPSVKEIKKGFQDFLNSEEHSKKFIELYGKDLIIVDAVENSGISYIVLSEAIHRAVDFYVDCDNKELETLDVIEFVPELSKRQKEVIIAMAKYLFTLKVVKYDK